MMNMPSQQVIEMLRKNYPEGSRVSLVSMEDPYVKIPKGTEGTVQFVDDMATIHVRWDNGNSLGAVFGEDIINKL